MTEDTVRAALASLTPETGRDDWDDVLRRAAGRARRRGRVLRLALVPVACLLIVVPALAASGGFHGLIGSKPGAHLSAALRTPAGADAGRLELVLRDALWPFARDGQIRPRRFVPTRRGARFRHAFPVRWSLGLADGPAARGTLVIRPGRVHAGRRVATLCSPCPDGARGTLSLNLGQAMALLNGRLDVVTASPDARGHVVLRRRR